MNFGAFKLTRDTIERNFIHNDYGIAFDEAGNYFIVDFR